MRATNRVTRGLSTTSESLAQILLVSPQAWELVEVDLSGFGDPVNAGSRIVVEEQLAPHCYASSELEGGAVHYQEVDAVPEQHITRERGIVGPPRGNVEVRRRSGSPLGPAAEDEREGGTSRAEQFSRSCSLFGLVHASQSGRCVGGERRSGVVAVETVVVEIVVVDHDAE
jgi:hypothetical protein